MEIVNEKTKIKKKKFLENKENELQNYTISIFGVVRRLREQRWGMVHTSVINLFKN